MALRITRSDIVENAGRGPLVTASQAPLQTFTGDPGDQNAALMAAGNCIVPAAAYFPTQLPGQYRQR